MKKLLAFTLCLLMAAALAGCGGASPTPAVTAEVAPAPTVAAQGQAEGMLVSYSGNLLSIKSTGGQELIFDISKAVISTTHGLMSGDDIVVNYTGSINGTDTTGAVVTGVTDRSEDAGGSTQPETHTIQGTLLDATMNTLVLQTADMGSLLFTTLGAQMDIYNGMVIGNELSVTYQGEIVNGDTTGVKVLWVVDKAENKTQAAPTPGPDDQRVTITEVQELVWATQNLNVRSGWGTDYPRIGGLVAGACVTRSGICSDGWSRIRYGGDTGYVASRYLTTTEPTDPDQPDPYDTYYQIDGYVVDCSMSATVINHNGNELTFYTADAEHHYRNGICVGNYVTIEYSGELVGTDTSGVTVHCVTDSDDNDTTIYDDPGYDQPVIGTGAGPATVPQYNDPAYDDPEIGTGAGPVEEPDYDQPDYSDPEIGTGAGPADEPDYSQPDYSDPDIGTGAGPADEPDYDQPYYDQPDIGTGAGPVSMIPKVTLGPGPQMPASVSPTVTGTVVATTGNTVTLQTDDGATLTFSIDGSTMVDLDLEVGAYVTVMTQGSSTGNVNAAYEISPA